jgi:catechol 2,3-dioxygenase-like lactoylglutathione lyase family enzyme
MPMQDAWPAPLPVAQVRVARPTDRLDEVVRFYRDGLGLTEIGSFAGHAGYTGVMLGLPGAAYHLEFTTHDEGSPCPAPTRDNLLVFYIPDRAAMDRIIERLAAMGYGEVPPENPYWQSQGVTIEDPDGWRVVLMNTAGITPR